MTEKWPGLEVPRPSSRIGELTMPAELVVPELEIVRLTDGLGFGEGQISRWAIENQPGNEDLAALTDAAINSPHILIPISRDENGRLLEDDGCGDGRTVAPHHGAVFSIDKQYGRSLYRPKVFGGGATMATAMLIGLGEAKQSPLQEVFHDAIGRLSAKKIDFGAHIDSKATGDSTGCGAIDKAALIVPAAVKYQAEIRQTIEALGVSLDGLDEVAAAYGEYAAAIAGQSYSGRKVMDEIIANHKVIKELDGEHQETRIVIGFVDDTAINQGYVREQTNGRADVFAVAYWRLQRLATKMWPNPADAHQALLAELTYTLATAAVLAKGDQPIYLIKAKKS